MAADDYRVREYDAPVHLSKSTTDSLNRGHRNPQTATCLVCGDSLDRTDYADARGPGFEHHEHDLRDIEQEMSRRTGGDQGPLDLEPWMRSEVNAPGLGEPQFVYRGCRVGADLLNEEGLRGHVPSTRVTVNEGKLGLMLHHLNRSPTGFNWGYGGAGPGQLGYALIADRFGPEFTNERHQPTGGSDAENYFKSGTRSSIITSMVVSKLPNLEWVLSPRQLDLFAIDHLGATEEDIARARRRVGSEHQY